MARTFTLRKSPEDKLPKSLRDKLENPTTVEGSRHREMIEVILQCVGNGMREGELFDTMRANYPHKSPAEVRDAIAGAVKRNPQPTKMAQKLQVERVGHHKLRITSVPVETAPVAASLTGVAATLGLLETVFRPEEVVCITNCTIDTERGPIIGDKGTFWTVEKWRTHLTDAKKRGKRSNYFDCESGAWVRINPCKDENGNDAGVSDFRHCLLELEKKQLTADQQWSALKASGLPIAAVIDSAGGSMHAWVKVDAKTAEEFKERQQTIYAYLEDLNPDPANKNPSRFSRLPGVLRNGKEQRLLALNIGAKDWSAWESEIQDHEMPEAVGVESLESFDRKADPNSMIGARWLCRGGSLIIQGQSGIGKSSFLMQAAITWALGRDLFGIKPKSALRSVILQAENDVGDMAEMYQDARDGMKLDRDERGEVASNLKFYREQSRTGSEFIRVAERVILKTKADIIFADPLLAFVGDDISKQEVASRFLRNWLNPVLSATGVIWVWLHHVGKPKLNPQSNATIKDQAYSGFGSSELVNWAREVATLSREDGAADVYSFTLAKRHARSGLLDGDGKPTCSARLKHASGRIHWERATPKIVTAGQREKARTGDDEPY